MASPRSWACQGTGKGIQSGHVAGKSRSTATASVHSFIWQFPKGASWRRKPGLTFHYQPCDHGQVTPLSPASISTSHPLKHFPLSYCPSQLFTQLTAHLSSWHRLFCLLPFQGSWDYVCLITYHPQMLTCGAYLVNEVI